MQALARLFVSTKDGEGLNRILVVDTDPVIRSGICSFLAAQGYAVSQASNPTDADLQFDSFRPNVIILDLDLPSGDGTKVFRFAKRLQPDFPILVLSGHAPKSFETKALERGAAHVFVKPVELAQLHTVLLRLPAQLKSARLAESSPAKAQREYLDPFIGTSAAIRRLREIASRVLPSESPILLQGETGAGKGVLANWIHHNGPRADQPFLDLNCAGLSRELLESELFGHEKGAFTSAVSAKQGLLEVANHGTVFLDEIGDIDLQVQPKLLKVLEDRVFRRLGEVRDRAVDIRLISATHRELLELVRQQRFRSDLYFRVNIVYIQVPCLRERVEDISPLAQHLVQTIARNCKRQEMHLSSSAIMALQRYSWPGNIRELRNVLERAALVAGHDTVTPDHLHFQTALAPELSRLGGLSGTLKQMERAYIHHVLHDESGSIERAARRLGIPRSSLYNKMKRFEIPYGTGRM